MLREMKIIKNQKMEKDIFLLRLERDLKIDIFPGQFAMLRINDSYDPLLSRPLSIYKVSDDSIEFLYKIVGRGTYLLSNKKQGDKIKVLLPLGNRFPLPIYGEKIALVGGGMGIVPLSFLLDYIYKDVDVYSYIGFPTKIHEGIWENFKEKSKFFLLSTEDGSLGEKGVILDFIFDIDRFDRLYACGPTSMLMNLWRKVKHKEKLYLSLEEKMACGFGVCLGCVFRNNGKNLHICKDGPVFSGVEVNFSESQFTD